AQTPPTAPAQPPARTTIKDMATAPAATDAGKLLGRNVKNSNNDTIGKIESVYLDTNGKVDSVIVGVGGFLGVGERYAQLRWKDLQVSDNGEKVVLNMTKEQLKVIAPYKYKDGAMRAHVFTYHGAAPRQDRTIADN